LTTLTITSLTQKLRCASDNSKLLDVGVDSDANGCEASGPVTPAGHDDYSPYRALMKIEPVIDYVADGRRPDDWCRLMTRRRHRYVDG